MRGTAYLYAYGALFALMSLCLIFERGELIDPMPGILYLVAGASGAALGYLAGVEADRLGWLKTGYRTALWIAGLTILGFFAAWVVTDSLALRVVFAGTSARTELTLVDVVDRDRSSRRRSFSSPRYSLVARLPGSADTVRIKASKALYDKVGARPPVGEYCVELPVKTGRWGIRAVWTPNAADDAFDLPDLRPCGRTGGF